MTGTPNQTAILRLLLSEALDLCVRARRLDEHWEWVTGDENRNSYRTVSATVPLWVENQYDKDLDEWEAKARKVLS